MTFMTSAQVWPDVWPHEDRPLTVADLEHMPDDGSRYELDEGMLIVSPAPFTPHQVVVTRLSFILMSACPREFIAATGPGINLGEFQHRVPDIAVVRAEGFRMAEAFEDRPPALAVEVASRSTARYDRTRKKAVYEQYGVQSYWIVTPEPDRPGITSFELTRGRYRQSAHVAGDDPFEAGRPFRVSFTPARLIATDPLR